MWQYREKARQRSHSVFKVAAIFASVNEVWGGVLLAHASFFFAQILLFSA